MREHTGEVFGSYRLLRHLGSGGFAEVYLGEHLQLGTQVAVKIRSTQLDSQEVERFQNEARVVARLKHPHIVQVIDFEVHEAVPFLVMEYATKGTLQDKHPYGERVSLPFVISYSKQIASALQYAHENKIVHRDVKPSNTLVNGDDHLLVSDFGTAISIAHTTSSLTTLDMQGTPAYMAPEQLLLENVQPATDQYALAIMIYEWLCGENPFGGNALQGAVLRTHKPAPLLSLKLPTISFGVQRVIQKALETRPEDRFSTITQFVLALEQASQPHARPGHPSSKSPFSPIKEGKSFYSVPTEEAPVQSFGSRPKSADQVWDSRRSSHSRGSQPSKSQSLQEAVAPNPAVSLKLPKPAQVIMTPASSKERVVTDTGKDFPLLPCPVVLGLAILLSVGLFLGWRPLLLMIFGSLGIALVVVFAFAVLVGFIMLGSLEKVVEAFFCQISPKAQKWLIPPYTNLRSKRPCASKWMSRGS